jgi:hypothetical protein
MDRSASILAINVPEPCPLLLPLFTVSSSCLWGWVCGEGGGGGFLFLLSWFLLGFISSLPNLLGTKVYVVVVFLLVYKMN